MNTSCVNFRRFLFVSLLFAVSTAAHDSLAVAAETATDSETPVSYWTDVRPIFQAHCQGCHQPAKDSGEYIMTAFESLTTGGESGEPAIVAGDPEGSYLIGLITPVDGKAEMPQDQPPLSEAELAKIVRWVKEGARTTLPLPRVRSLTKTIRRSIPQRPF